MIQAFLISPSAFGASQQYFSVFDGRPGPTTIRVNTEGIVTCAGTFRKLKVRHTAPTSGKSRTWTFYKNGSATALTCTISDSATSAEDSSNTVSVAVGDKICISHQQSGSPAENDPYYVDIEFESSETGVSIYGCASSDQPNNSLTAYCGALLGDGTYSTSAAGLANKESLIGPPGTITEYRVDVVTAPGSGKSRTYALVKNGVTQDGTGGTPNTTCTISDSATSATASGFSLSVVQGDRVAYAIVPTSSPTNSAHRFGLKFTASTDGQYMLGTMTADGITNATTEYNWVGGHGETWTTTEADRRQTVGLTNIRLLSMYVRLSATPTSGSTYTFTARKNGAATSLTLALTTQTGSITAATDTTDGDLLGVQVVQSGTGDTCSGKVVFVAGPVNTQIVGSMVAGVKTTVKATRSIAFGLDDNTNVHDTAGMFKVFGDAHITGNLTLGGSTLTISNAILQTIIHSIVTAGGEVVVDSNGHVVFSN